MTIDVRGTSLLVRDALQVYADQQAGRAAGAAKPLADDLADRIANGLVPTLRQAYLDMAAMQVEWEEESFQTQLADAAASGRLVAGYSPPHGSSGACCCWRCRRGWMRRLRRWARRRRRRC